MEDPYTYMKGIAPASEGLFKLLNQYNWQKMRAFIALTNSKTRLELNTYNDSFRSTDIAREVIAGSILQIANVAIERYSKPIEKPVNALRFESEINRLISEYPERQRSNKKFELPLKFCVGREIGDLSIGVIIHAGRNQYNHFHDGNRLSVFNEVIFNYLHNMWPDSGNGLSFDLKPGKLSSYSVLGALGWTDTSIGLGYDTYKKDMAKVLKIEL